MRGREEWAFEGELKIPEGIGKRDGEGTPLTNIGICQYAARGRKDASSWVAPQENIYSCPYNVTIVMG